MPRREPGPVTEVPSLIQGFKLNRGTVLGTLTRFLLEFHQQISHEVAVLVFTLVGFQARTANLWWKTVVGVVGVAV